MPDPDLLASARAQRAGDLAAIADLTDDQLDYLARVDELPDPASDGIEHDDGPHLTVEEWEYVRAVTGG